MKRFLKGGKLHGPTWPEPDKREGAHLFAPRPRYRKLVVMIDNELLTEMREFPITKNALLSDLLASRLIQVYRYRDDGPPSTIVPRPGTPPVYEGWAVITDADPEHERWLVRYDDSPDSWTDTGIMGNAVAIAAGDERVAVYNELGPTVAAERRRADGLAAQVAAQGLEADVYVTERAYLHEAKWDLARGVALCRPDEALALVGLYLRAQGEYLICNKMTFNRGLYYWVGTRELLPSSWRWFAACVKHGEPTGDTALALLGQSVLQRVERALEARDGVHLALNQPQDNDTRREILSHLDDVLVNLMGAVDAAARVAHRVLAIRATNEFRAG